MSNGLSCIRLQVLFLWKRGRPSAQGQQTAGEKRTWVPIPASSLTCLKTFSDFCPVDDFQTPWRWGVRGGVSRVRHIKTCHFSGMLPSSYNEQIPILLTLRDVPAAVFSQPRKPCSSFSLNVTSSRKYSTVISYQAANPPAMSP